MIKQYLGIDYGLARIGLAIGNDQGRIASPLQVVENTDDPIAVVEKIAQNKAIDELVLGLPRGLDGQETTQTKLVRQFGDRLMARGLTVHLQDEASTSQVAAERLSSSKRPRRLTKGSLDLESAAIILQDFLDALPSPDPRV